MTRPGRVLISTRERAVSNDIVRAQDLFGQDMMEIIRGISGLVTDPDTASIEDRKVVFQGLAPTPGGAGLSVDVTPGIGAIQANAGVPAADLSAYELVRRRDSNINLVLAAADPVNPRFDLIEVEAADDLTESQNRDIFDPATNTFNPALVEKIRRAGSSFTVTTGVVAANPVVPAFSATATDRMPVGIIRVPALAAAIVDSDIIDLRPLYNPAPFTRAHGLLSGLKLTTPDLADDSAAFNVLAGEAFVDGQYVKRAAGSTQTFADVGDANTAFAGSTWYYVYLVACRDGVGCRPRHENSNVDGIIIVSDVQPDTEGRPLSALAFPNSGAQFSTRKFAGESTSRALYLGAIRTGTLATEVGPFQRQGEWIKRDTLTVQFTIAAGLPDTINIDLSTAQLTPASCRAVRGFFDIDLTQASNFTGRIRARTAGSTGKFDALLFDMKNDTAASQTEKRVSPEVEVPLDSSRIFEVEASALAGANNFSAVALAHEFNLASIHDPLKRFV